jgi:hypothetical protein
MDLPPEGLSAFIHISLHNIYPNFRQDNQQLIPSTSKMETIKNILYAINHFLTPDLILTFHCRSGNTEKNDKVAHGSGRELGTTETYQGLSGEGKHLAEAQNAPGGTTSGLTSHQTSGVTSTSTGSTHPMARDAAIAASGVGLAGQYAAPSKPYMPR